MWDYFSAYGEKGKKKHKKLFFNICFSLSIPTLGKTTKLSCEWVVEEEGGRNVYKIIFICKFCTISTTEALFNSASLYFYTWLGFNLLSFTSFRHLKFKSLASNGIEKYYSGTYTKCHWKSFYALFSHCHPVQCENLVWQGMET